MNGYDPNFLEGEPILLPRFTAELDGLVLKNGSLDQHVFAHYPNYTVVTHREMRSPILAALNIDQESVERHKARRNDRWRIDSRIGSDFQLNNDYYKKNRWDRGHLARRESAGWGSSIRDAQHASDETFYYSNSTLQHENFNQDEWLELEEWVLNNENTKDRKITSFSIPYFGGDMRTVRPAGREPAFVPSAFFKVVVFVNNVSGQLETRAFMMVQDEEALRDKNGRHAFSYQRYQVTTTEVEEKTGLVFDNRLYSSNPLFFHATNDETAAAHDALHVRNLPELIEVDGAGEIVGPDTLREEVVDDEVEVYLSGAMVNPAGADREGEWISILNMSNQVYDLGGWELSDMKRPRIKVGEHCEDCVLQPGEGLVVKSVAPLMLGNNGGVVALYDDSGRRIDRLKYSKKDVKEGMPVNFFYQESLRF